MLSRGALPFSRPLSRSRLSTRGYRSASWYPESHSSSWATTTFMTGRRARLTRVQRVEFAHGLQAAEDPDCLLVVLPQDRWLDEVRLRPRKEARRKGAPRLSGDEGSGGDTEGGALLRDQGRQDFRELQVRDFP